MLKILLTSTALVTAGTAAQADGVPSSPVDMQRELETAGEVVDKTEFEATESVEKHGQDALDTISERSDMLEAKMGAEIQHEKDKAAHAQSKIDDGKVHQLEGRWERTSFKYDRPEIRVWNKDVAIPTVHVTFNNRKLAFHHPAVCTVGRTKTLKSKTEWKVKSIGFGIKTKVPVTTTWWDYTDIKGPCMKRAEIVTKVPEFKSGTTSVPVPQIKVDWKTVEASFHTWKLMDRNWQDELEEAGDAAGAAKKEVKRGLETINVEELAAFEKEAKADIDTRFKAARKKIVAGRERAAATFVPILDEMRKQRADVEGQIRDAKGDPTEALAGFDEVIRTVEGARDKVRTQFDQVLKDLEARRAATLERALGSLNAST